MKSISSEEKMAITTELVATISSMVEIGEDESDSLYDDLYEVLTDHFTRE